MFIQFANTLINPDYITEVATTEDSIVLKTNTQRYVKVYQSPESRDKHLNELTRRLDK